MWRKCMTKRMFFPLSSLLLIFLSSVAHETYATLQTDSFWVQQCTCTWYVGQHWKSPFTPMGTEVEQTLKQRLCNFFFKEKSDWGKVVSRRDKAGYEKKGLDGEKKRGSTFSLCDPREMHSGVISLSKLPLSLTISHIKFKTPSGSSPSVLIWPRHRSENLHKVDQWRVKEPFSKTPHYHTTRIITGFGFLHMRETH